MRERALWLLAGLGALFHLPMLVAGETYFFRDLWVYYLPMRRMLGEALRAGDWPPLWNPLLHGGVPFAADMSSASFYPSAALYAALPAVAALNLEIVLHTVFASVAAYVLARVLGFLPLPSLVTGIAYAYAGYSLSHADLLVVHLAWPWLPVVLAAWHRHLLGRGRRAFAVAAVAAAMQALAGGPEIVALTHLATLLWVMAAPGLARREQLRAAGRWLALVLVVVALAAVQLVPMVELARESQRGEGIDWWDWANWSVAPQQLPELVIPGFFGHLDRFGEKWYWGARRVDTGAPYMLSLYLGLGVVLLGLAGVFTAGPLPVRTRAALAALAGAAVLAAMGRHLPGVHQLYELLPPVRLIRYPVKAINAAVLPLALLAAQGVTGLSLPSGRSWLRLACWGVAALLGTAAAALWLRFPLAETALGALLLAPPDAAREGVARALLHAAAVAGALALTLELQRAGAGRRAAVAATAVVVADLLIAGQRVQPRTFSELLTLAPPALPALRATVGDGRLFRDRDPDFAVHAPTDEQVWKTRFNLVVFNSYFAFAYGVPVIAHEDFHGLAPRRTVLAYALLRTLPWHRRPPVLAALGARAVVTAADVAPLGLTPAAVLSVHREATIGLYRLADAVPAVRWVPRWIPAPEPVMAAQRMGAGFSPREEAVVEELRPPPAGPCAGAATVQERLRAPARWIVEARTPCAGYLVFHQLPYPGWEASRDRQPVPLVPTDLISTGVFLPAGTHTVELRYTPRALLAGATVTGLAGLALAVWTLRPGRRRLERRAGGAGRTVADRPPL